MSALQIGQSAGAGLDIKTKKRHMFVVSVGITMLSIHRFYTSYRSVSVLRYLFRGVLPADMQ
jgi:hypothetical protein